LREFQRPLLVKSAVRLLPPHFRVADAVIARSRQITLAGCLRSRRQRLQHAFDFVGGCAFSVSGFGCHRRENRSAAQDRITVIVSIIGLIVISVGLFFIT
jgi:hypothetical protein